MHQIFDSNSRIRMPKKISTKSGWQQEVEDAGLDISKLADLVTRAPVGCESEVYEIEKLIAKFRAETTKTKVLAA